MEKETRLSSASDSERPEEILTYDKDVEPESAAEVRLSRPSSAAVAGPPAVPEPPINPSDSIPDGGLEAWLQVVGSWVILVGTWGMVNSYGVFQTYYETELLSTSSSSSISWIGSIQAALLTLVGVLSGPLFDQGYFRQLLLAGNFLIVFGLFMTSLCTTYWQVLLAQGVTMGLGMGLTFLPSAAILAQYFRRRRALALGISSTGSPVAGIVVPILFSRLQPTVGFGWATRVIAFVLLALSAVPVACMHTRVPAAGKSRSLFDVTALGDGPFLLTIGSLFFLFLVLYVAFFYLQLFTESMGLAGRDFSPYLVTFLNLGSVPGRVVPNAIADRAGNLNVLLGCALASALLLLGWLGIDSLGGLVAFALLYGLFSGGIVSVTPSVIMSLTPDLGRVGARLGMCFLMTGTSVLVGTPIAGAILGSRADAGPQWRGTIGYAAGGLLVGSLGCLAARVAFFRKKGGLRA